MSELIVIAFDDETGAAQLRDALVGLQKQGLITLDDAAIVVRGQGGKLSMRQAVHLVGAGVFGGAFWGMFIGLLFWMPWLGMAIGVTSGAGALGDHGMDDGFIKEVTKTIEPGHSALFLLVREAKPDKLVDGLEQFNGKVLQTSLSPEAAVRLKETFGVHEE